MSGLVKLTRPDKQPVWVAAGQVCSIQKSNQQVNPGSQTLIVLAQGSQPVIELPDDVATAVAKSLSDGGH